MLHAGLRKLDGLAAGLPAPCEIKLVRPDASFCAAFFAASERLYPAILNCRDEWLHPRETACFEAIRAGPRRADYLLGRYCAKRAAGHLLREPDLGRIEISAGVFQQPVVKAFSPDAPGVCITHSHGKACAIAFPAEHPMAIDLERADSDRLGLLKQEIGVREMETVLTPQNETALYTQLWTAREALSKILRCGLTAPFALFETGALSVDEGVCRGVFRNFTQYRFESAVLADFALGIVLPRNTKVTFDWASMREGWM